jgi:hypothetical protein
LIEISMGIEPKISMTAKSVKVSVRNSCRLNCMWLVFAKVLYSAGLSASA